MSTPGLLEESDGILGIFVKVRVEYSLIHEIRVAADVEENPSQVVKSERGENERIAGYGVLYSFSVRADRFFAARLDLGNDREAVVGRVFGKIGPYRPCSSLKYPSLGMAIAAGFVQSPAFARAASCSGTSTFASASLIVPAGFTLIGTLICIWPTARSEMPPLLQLPCRGMHGEWFHLIFPST